MRRKTSVIAVAVLSLAVGVLAQAPSLAGKWTLVVDPNAPAGGGGRGGRGGGGFGQFCGMECTIAQDATSLTVTRTTQAGETKTVYKLDGSESKNTQDMGGRGTLTSVSKATVSGGKVMITTNTDMSAFGGASQEAKMTLSLEGGNLVVERTAPGFQDPTPVTTKQTYKKN
jgi:hypothetical protein